jgi:hypothetical protein
MMKKSFLMIAVCAMFAVSVTSCKKDEEKTGYDYLVEAKHGWKLTTATSNPAYKLEAGASITNLFQGFIKDCEVDDIMYFNTDKSQKLNPGKDKQTNVLTDGKWACNDASETTLGTWALAEGEKSFTSFHLPYFDENMAVNTIISLDENTLIVSIPVQDDEGNNVVMTLTYTKQ